MIVSPTYDGVVSDVKKIAEVAHANEIPLIVDEAHGAHLDLIRIFRKMRMKMVQTLSYIVCTRHFHRSHRPHCFISMERL